LKTDRIRSFIAVDVSDNSILDNISKVQVKLKESGADLKQVKPNNIHITLRFLGEISSSILEKVMEQMENITVNSFDLELREVGTFPSIKYPKIVWIGMNKGSTELGEIHEQLEPRLREIGFMPDKKGFSPHLTIARVRTGRNKRELVDILNEIRSYDFGTMRAEFLRLKRSTLTPNGPIYSTLHEVFLEPS